jgi:hypothetical protein
MGNNFEDKWTIRNQRNAYAFSLARGELTFAFKG